MTISPHHLLGEKGYLMEASGHCLKKVYGIFLWSFSALVWASSSVFADIPKSLQVVNPNGIVSIEKEDLGKEFLLRSSYIVQTVSPTGESPLSRIVYFHLPSAKSEKIYLIESSQGHLGAKDLPSKVILAEFTIKKRTKNSIEFSFGEGIAHYFLNADINVAYEFSTYDPEYRNRALEVDRGFIEEASVQNDTLYVRQIVQVKYDDDVLPTYEIRYYLTPYSRNPDFKSKENSELERFGYFQTTPFLEPGTGRTSNYINRWHIEKEKPITYYISSNTPEDFRKAVAEGIQYWNKAFGFEALKVEMAPEGMSAPYPGYNIVQWVDWDKAGYAYADYMADPLTGEIKQSQIYVTSMFALRGKSRIQELIRTYSADSGQNEEPSVGELLEKSKQKDLISYLNALKDRKKTQEKEHHKKGHSRRHHLCDLNVTKHMVQALKELNLRELEDASILRISQNYIRSVVAHEVGHTLGLTHNFLGKHLSSMPLQEKEDLFREYVKASPREALKILKQNKAALRQLNSSVMDYPVFQDDILIGHLIGLDKKPLPYDQAVIDWGYGLKENVSTNLLYCGDEGTIHFEDCQHFDHAAPPMVSNQWEIEKSIERIPSEVISAYIAAKSAVDPRDRIALEQVKISTKPTLKNIAKYFEKQLRWLDSSTRSVVMERQFPGYSDLHLEERQKKQLEWVKFQIESLGGVEKVFFQFLPIADDDGDSVILAESHFQKAEKAFLEQCAVLEKEGFRGADNKQHQFAPKELALIKSTGEAYFSTLKKNLVQNILYMFYLNKMDLEHTVTKYLGVDSLTRQIERGLAQAVHSILMEEDEDAISGRVNYGDHLSPTLLVQTPKYDFDTRFLALYLLNPLFLGFDESWALPHRRSIATELLQNVEGKIGRRLTVMDVAKIEPPLRQWFMENFSLLDLVSKMDPAWECAELLSPKPKKK